LFPIGHANGIVPATNLSHHQTVEGTGFTLAFDINSPFTPDGPIMGGANKPMTLKAQTPGCYKYDIGASASGAIYGMSGNTRKPELVILP
jgi:hypothetical protein